MKYEAKYDEATGYYECPGLGVSTAGDDGNEWLDSDSGQPADSAEFHAATITFVGGPLYGKTVA